jgi:hypothetical protein
MSLFEKYMPPPATLATVATPQYAECQKTVAGVATVADEMRYSETPVDPTFELPVNGAKNLPAYCPTTGAWCSSRLGLSPCWNCEPTETVNHDNCS